MTLILPEISVQSPGRTHVVKHFVQHNTLFVLGLTIFALIVFAALFAPWVAPYDPSSIDFKSKLIAVLLGTVLKC